MRIRTAPVQAGKRAVVTGVGVALILEATARLDVGIAAMSSRTVRPPIGGPVNHSSTVVVPERAPNGSVGREVRYPGGPGFSVGATLVVAL
jgi:hypothetical protein